MLCTFIQEARVAQYREQATGWNVRDSNPNRGKRFFVLQIAQAYSGVSWSMRIGVLFGR
jgi:hypothetical protein